MAHVPPVEWGMPHERYCPDCGHKTLFSIEDTEPDAAGEYKEVLSCPSCQNIVYIVRNPNDVSVVSDDEPLPDHGDWAEAHANRPQ